MIGSTKYTTMPSSAPVNKKNISRKYFFYFIMIVLLVIIIAVFFSGGKEQKVNDSLQKEINEFFDILKEDDTKDNIFKYIKIEDNRLETNQATDYQYLVKAKVGAKIGEYINNPEAVIIEIYNNADDLKPRVEYLKAQNNYLDEIYENGAYGYLPSIANLPGKRFIYTKKNVLMSIDETISSDLISTYSNILSKVVNEINFEQKEYPAQRDLDELKEYYDGKLNAWKQKYSKNTLINSINQLVNNMEKQVDLAYASNDEFLVNSRLDELTNYDVTKFQEKYLYWKEQLTIAKENLSNGTISSDMLEKNNAYKQMVYDGRVYVVGRDILPGEYVIVKNGGSKDSSVFVNSEKKVSGNTIINVGDDLIGKLVILDGVTMYHIDNLSYEAKITQTFKVGKHIEPGEYEVSYKYNDNVFVLDEINGIIDESKAVKYEIGPEPKTITIKDGQYIVWNYNNLQINIK